MPSAGNSTAQSSRAVLAGLIALVAAIFLAEWTSAPVARGCAVVIALVAGSMLYRELRTFDRAYSPGKVPVARAWMTTILLTAVFAGLLLGLGWIAGSWHWGKSNWLDKSSQHWFTTKLATVALQQMVLQWLVVPALMQLTRSASRTFAIAATIFAAMHLPNPILMLLTFGAGLAWSMLYVSQRRLAPIIVSHFALAVLAAGSGGEYLLNLRVGTACVELLPTTVDTTDRVVVVFPGCVTGNVVAVSQHRDRLILEGWARDEIHQSLPTEFFILANHQLSPMQKHAVESLSSSWLVGRHPPGRIDDGFRVSIPISRLQGVSDVRILARNANGWFAELNSNGPIELVDRNPTIFPIALYPTIVDGRLDRVECEGNSIRIRGWVADIEQQTVPSQLLIKSNDEWIPIDLANHRIARQDIANSTGSRELKNCGFDIAISNLILPGTVQPQVIARSSGDAMYYRIPLTSGARAMVAANRHRKAVPSANQKSVFR